ncbi:MAG: pyridoxal phosphate-dependent aminotransferase [Bacteroidota bacterium]|nr:pyridoxal phosphate-dependent aminotransferase [Bacteroidota bacterium]
MKETPFNQSDVQSIIDSYHLPEFGKATIREVVEMANRIEKKSGKRFIHMEMGVPGLPASQIGIQAEIDALKKGVASIYPPMSGIPEFKEQASRFVKAFIDVDVPPACCTPVTGSMQGTMASFITCTQRDKSRRKVLFIDPGFPVQKMQLTMMRCPYESFDVYNFRGEALKEELEKRLQKNEISTILYSNPNNPSWICLQDSELKAIGELATKYDIIIMEDLAYFAMDFRKDLSKPFEPPFQASVAKYTKNYILLISGSKAFSYAGQRIGFTAVSETLFKQAFDDLTAQYGTGEFGNILVNRVLYGLSAGTTHSVQYAMAAMMKAACDGTFNFVDMIREYGRRAKRVKRLFTDNGFYIVYDKDLDEDLADGFYFTVAWPGMAGGELMKELMFYGISTISLETTGSDEEGLRICTSFIKDDQYDDLQERLVCFKANH